MERKFRFAVGDRVSTWMGGRGAVVATIRDPKLKPYVVEYDDGSGRFGYFHEDALVHEGEEHPWAAKEVS